MWTIKWYHYLNMNIQTKLLWGIICWKTSIWVFPKIGVYTPKSSILIGFSIIFTIHFGGYPSPYCWFNSHITITTKRSLTVCRCKFTPTGDSLVGEGFHPPNDLKKACGFAPSPWTPPPLKNPIKLLQCFSIQWHKSIYFVHSFLERSQCMQKRHQHLPSLKLTASSPLKMDGWNTIVSFWDSTYFQGISPCHEAAKKPQNPVSCHSWKLPTRNPSDV